MLHHVTKTPLPLVSVAEYCYMSFSSCVTTSPSDSYGSSGWFLTLLVRPLILDLCVHCI